MSPIFHFFQQRFKNSAGSRIKPPLLEQKDFIFHGCYVERMFHTLDNGFRGEVLANLHICYHKQHKQLWKGTTTFHLHLSERGFMIGMTQA